MKETNTKLKEAVATLVQALRTDESYRNSWKANIAMAFQDEWYRSSDGANKVHEVANAAADLFLNILCQDVIGISVGRTYSYKDRKYTVQNFARIKDDSSGVWVEAVAYYDSENSKCLYVRKLDDFKTKFTPCSG